MLRLHVGLSTRELAALLGRDWSQSKVSRVERGVQATRIPDVRAWAVALDAPPDAVEDLVDLAEAALFRALDWRIELAGGLEAKQEATARLEAEARRLRVFGSDVVPGLLQTLDYARHVLCYADPRDDADLVAGAAGRIARQQILYQPGRTFEFVVAELAFGWRPGPAPMMAAQVAHVAAAAQLPNVTVGVIPADIQAPHYFGGFDLLDDRLAIIETHTRELHIDNPDEVAVYAHIFDRLQAAAASGAEAASLLARLERRFVAE